VRPEALEIFRVDWRSDRRGDRLGHLGEIALHVADSAKRATISSSAWPSPGPSITAELEGECELFSANPLQAADLPCGARGFTRSLEVAKDSENKRGEASRFW
jgi:hypothetical protein